MALVFARGSSESLDGGALVLRRARQGDELDPSTIIADFYIGDAPRTVTRRTGDPSALTNIGGELREDLDGSGPDGVNTHYPVRVQQTGEFSIAVAREALAVAAERLTAVQPLSLERDQFLARQFGKARLVARCSALLELAAARGKFKGAIVP